MRPTFKRTAHITLNRARVKQHDKIVYLKNGDEYQIELYNGSPNVTLASIGFDGEIPTSGNGIILQPGERVFLERFLNSSKKFKFYEYDISSKDQNLVSNNGLVNIYFFDLYTAIYNYCGTPIAYYSNSSGNNVLNSRTYASSTTSVTNFNYVLGSNATYTVAMSDINAGLNNSKKTGVTVQGEESNQKFTLNNGYHFNSIASEMIQWKILPKMYETTTNVNACYCTSCGAKRKKDHHKFCPLCGTKYE